MQNNVNNLFGDYQKCFIRTTPIITQHEIYLSGTIDEQTEYTDVIHLIKNAPETDFIRIYINSEGGDIHAGIQLLNAIHMSAANITCVLDGVAYSFAPLILFSGDEIEVNENAMIMFHNYSSVWEVGKGNEISSSITAYNKLYKQLLENYGKPFLTDDQIQAIINGQDFYFTYDDIVKRLKLMVKEREDNEREAAAKKAKKTVRS